MALPLSIKINKIKLFSLMNNITQYLHCIIRIQIAYTFIIFQIPRIISFKKKSVIAISIAFLTSLSDVV